uniref:COP9 signalosome complex subunit 4 n=1 Tax=Glossina brevipalpis TaxID=37001 RepID=A0A1A9WCS6_9MUSC
MQFRRSLSRLTKFCLKKVCKGQKFLVSFYNKKMVITLQFTIQRLLNINDFVGPQSEHVERYLYILEQIITNTGYELPETFQVFVTNMINRRINVLVARLVLNELVFQLSQIPDRIAWDLCKFTLVKLQPRIICFEEHVCGILQHMANILERFYLFREAAETLLTVPLERGHRRYAASYKSDTYVKISHLFLEANDVKKAETYISRATLLQADITEKDSITLYKKCYAQVLDRTHKFTEAARRYAELSSDADECMHFLTKAFICTVLSTAGQQRSRILALLVRDKRTKLLPGNALIAKLYYNVIIKQSDLRDFKAMLQPHQKFTTPNGVPFLERSIYEHNLLSVSKIYNNISFVQLGVHLETTRYNAETFAADMIRDGRLNAHINQIGDRLEFKNYQEVSLLDTRIVSICNQLSSIFNKITIENPIWLTQIEAEKETENENKF